MYLTLIDVGLSFLQQYIGGMKSGKAPAEVIGALQAAADKLFEHRADVISKSNLDALRG